MNLPTVFETCVPRENVLNEGTTETGFALDHANVIDGNAPDDRRSSGRFLAYTFPSSVPDKIARDVLDRLSGDGVKMLIERLANAPCSDDYGLGLTIRRDRPHRVSSRRRNLLIVFGPRPRLLFAFVPARS